MPRKQFMADLETVITKSFYSNIHDICKGEDDGQITFLCTHSKITKPVRLYALVSDLGDYPDNHMYMTYADENTPPDIAQTIMRKLTESAGKPVAAFLQDVSTAVQSYDPDFLDNGHDDSDIEMQDEDDEFDDDLDDEYGFSQDLNPAQPSTLTTGLSNKQRNAKLPADEQNAIREDLRAVKKAGFRVGYHGFLLQGQLAIVSVSCRISKLGISEEAMKAWQVRADEYLTLLIRFPNGYRRLEQLIQTDLHSNSNNYDMRVVIGGKYKPDHESATRFFHSKRTHDNATNTKDPEAQTGFRDTFISEPLNDLLNTKLIKLTFLRSFGLDWTGAEDYLRDNLGVLYLKDGEVPAQNYFNQETLNREYPPIVTSDHTKGLEVRNQSFPLIAMQFLLRHYVFCTSFCLVCHRQLKDDLEALKPYVCESALCLYQYMALGLGPSIDHEIVAQPVVVDLLVSFCYSAAVNKKMTSFPSGLDLKVPPGYDILARRSFKSLGNHQDLGVACQINVIKNDLHFENHANSPCPFRTGDWIYCQPEAEGEGLLHCRITETIYYPFVHLGSINLVPKLCASMDAQDLTMSGVTKRPITIRVDTSSEVAPPKDQYVNVLAFKHDIHFDTLDDEQKAYAVICLLDSLPSVEEMKVYIETHPGKGLKSWVNRITPSAFGLLRWIIASNRACIIHVEGSNDNSSCHSDQLIHGVPGWKQFRFAMGAPDKERRFVRAVRETTQRLSLQYPTIFAWHGSGLSNWHSIIREGLNFNKTVNGRAYGNGCYHSLLQSTSTSYCSERSFQTLDNVGVWPQSSIRPSTAMSLNEIVNAPKEFVSISPHLVVSQLDWIQTRYLFVMGSQVVAETDQKPHANVHKQDPLRLAFAESGQPIIIPAAAIKNICDTKRKSSDASVGTKQVKTVKKTKKSGNKATAIKVEEIIVIQDTASQASDDEDLCLLEENSSDSPLKITRTDHVLSTVKGSFRPGTLDHNLLPKTPEPSYANIVATKRLQMDFRALLKVQQSTPLHELGWYIDPEKFDNVYQWIVELHSFDQFSYKGGKLPLAKDMEKVNVESVVLEIRFGATYPMSPPFVRVIQPRFLGFQAGGGGHVTAGGAMCMELLTNSGWSAASSIESVLLQVRLAIASTEPMPARLEQIKSKSQTSYGVGEAIEAYKRACRGHGWEIPKDFDATMAG